MKEKNVKPTALQLLGKNIKKIRLSRGLSQENLASDLQKSVNFISLLENGKTGVSVQTIIDICRVLNVDTNSLFTGIIQPVDTNSDSFIVDSLQVFNEDDKKMVRNLIEYILNTKH